MFGLTLDDKQDRQLSLPDLLAAMVADGLIQQEQFDELNSSFRPKDLENTHPITLIAQQAWQAAEDGSLLNEEAISMWLADKLGMPYLRIDPLKTDVQAVTALASFKYVSNRHILPVEVKGNKAIFATSEPLQQKWVHDLGSMIQKDIEVVLATPANVEKYTLEFYSLAKSVNMAGDDPGIRVPGINNLEQLVQLGESGNLDANDQHIVHIVDWLLQFAFEQRASDIHLEPRRDMSYVRFRIDGMLHMVYEVPTSIMTAIISRIKSIGGMDVIERRRPLDGRVKTKTPKGNEVELRLSTLPTAFGEKMVMRIFDPDVLVKGFTQLGFTKNHNEMWADMVSEPNGLILVTGPTGSGKTTTLYSTLKHIAKPELNVCTIEDPIELIEPQFNQMQVNASIGLKFSDGVRALLRQDPDVIMIGEIRDLETAEMAIQSSLTGHLVLSTLHTNSAIATISRLMEIGVTDYLLRSTLLGIVAQRLLRTLCPHCMQEGEVSEVTWAQLTRPMKMKMPAKVNQPVGCLECRNTGYLGRVGIYEMLRATQKLKDMIRTDVEQHDLYATAVREGMVPLNVNGALKVALGKTTPEEVMRVVSIT
ncbi:MAG: GspE/PulE family protein [Gammaproteobacteria bacterium]|nr:GspE/PulE family protein [Gammaproteobacteria bacterium]